MIWYFIAVSLHVLAAVLWIGPIAYCILAQPIAKRFGSPEASRLLEEISVRLNWLGWPCLTTALATGIFLLYYQGVRLSEIGSGHLFVGAFGNALEAKLLLVGAMVIFQLFFNMRPRTMGWLLVLVGIIIIPLSALLVR